MESSISLSSICIPSEDVVARVIEGEVIIVPLVSGIGDMEDELYTLNDTGRAIWNLLDGKRSLKDIVSGLSEEFDASASEIENDVKGLVDELCKRKMLIEVTGS